MKNLKLTVILQILLTTLAFGNETSEEKSDRADNMVEVSGTTLILSGTAAGALELKKIPNMIEKNQIADSQELEKYKKENAAYRIRMSRELGEEYVQAGKDVDRKLGNRTVDNWEYSKHLPSPEDQKRLISRYSISEQDIETATFDKAVHDRRLERIRDRKVESYKKAARGLWTVFFTSFGATVTALNLEPDQDQKTSLEVDNSELLKDVSQDESLIAEKTEKEKRSPGASAY